MYVLNDVGEIVRYPDPFSPILLKRKEPPVPEPEYVPCEYIDFDGLSYLDLAPLTTESDIEITFRRENGYTQTNFLFGTNPNSNTSPVVGAWYGSQGFSTQNGSLRNSASLDTDWHTVKFTATKTYLDGVEYGDAGTRLTFQNLIIGSARDERSGAVDSRAFHGDISRVKVGNKIFVPVKDVVTNAYGLFDIAGEKFYGNSGTGTITGGSLIQPVSYAQSDGSACVDTDLLLDGSEKWTMKFASLKAEFSSPVAGSLNGGTAFTNRNNYCVTYTTAITPHAYSVYADGNAGSSSASWNGGTATDKAWHTIEYFGNVNTPPKIDGVNMAQPTLTTLTPVTPSVPWRLFGRATTAKGQGTLSQDGVAIARFTGDTWDYLPVRIGTTVEMLDLVSWQFAQRTGTLTGGEDVPWKWS